MTCPGGDGYTPSRVDEVGATGTGHVPFPSGGPPSSPGAERYDQSQATYLFALLGWALAQSLYTSARLGHSSVRLTLHDYSDPPPYPPPDDGEAARAVVRETLLGGTAREILDRHPWIDMALAAWRGAFPGRERAVGVEP